MTKVALWCLVLMPSLAGLRAAEIESLAPGIDLIPGAFTPGQQPDGNTIVLTATSGLLIVDTGRHREHVAKIAAFASARRLPIKAIINTHWHLDHIGGNGRLRALHPQVRVYASAALSGALEGFLATYRRDLEQALTLADLGAEQARTFRTELELLDSAAALGPDEIIERSGERAIAGRVFDVHLERAATQGDVWLIDRQSRILIAGDLVTLPVPFLDTACPRRWSEVLHRISQQKFDVLVPGHGRAMTPGQVRRYAAAFDAFVGCAASTAIEKICIDGWLEHQRGFNDSPAHDSVGAMLSYYVQLLRDKDAQRRLCGE